MIMGNTLYALYKKHEGKVIKLDGISYKIRCREYNAKYPTKHIAYHVDLDPVNKRSEYYLKIKRKLGDDWSTDGLELGDESLMQVLKQLGVK
jgi:hypothetical protein